MTRFKSYLTFLLLAFAGLILVDSCTTGPDYPIEPVITFVGFSKSTIVQGSNSDTFNIIVDFTDGDGDIGTDNLGIDITILDERTGDNYAVFKIPEIPQAGANNGISGRITMTALNTCCTFPEETQIPPCESPAEFPTDELRLRIFMEDNAGNKSNEIVTPPITIRCI